MTRETKIGLLVGLLFIVAFGLVLSGLTNKDTPGNSMPSGEIVKSPGAVNPDVRTGSFTQELEEPARPVASVGSTTTAPAEPVAASGDGEERPVVAVVTPVAEVSTERTGEVAPQHAQVVARTHDGKETFGVQELTARAGEGEDPAVVSPVEPARTETPAVRTEAPAAGEVWEVKKGETLYAIAGQKYGRTNASKYKVILEANKDVIKSEKDLKIGMKLRIPPLESVPSNAVAPAGPAPMEKPVALPERTRSPEVVMVPTESVRPVVESVGPVASGRVYKVQRGDTLYGLSHKHGMSIDEIIKANPGKLKSQKDSLRIGTELTLRN